MARRPRQLSESGIYHVMLRGINKQAIFLDDEDHHRFLADLASVKHLSGCRILAYCLMKNHAHLVIRTGEEPIGSVMKRLGVRYVRWHNRKYDRVGHLFQDRFKSRPVDDEAYLVTLLRYVWNNPVEAGLTERAASYRWSSLWLHGQSGGLVEDEDLLDLMSPETLAQLTAQPEPEAAFPAWPIPDRESLTDAVASAYLALICAAFDVDDLRDLLPARRRRAVAELLERGLSTRQLVRLTGLSQTTIVRLARQAARDEAEAFTW